MPTPAYMTINGEKQGLITAGTFTVTVHPSPIDSRM